MRQVPGPVARSRRGVQVCHGRAYFSTAAGTGRIARIFAWCSLALAACSADGPAFRLAPIGTHEVYVGEPWSHALVLVGHAEPPLLWRVLQGPIGAQVLADAKGTRLYWLPDVLRLGHNPPGQPRKAGPPLPVTVAVTDAVGETATAVGELLVVPTPLP